MRLNFTESWRHFRSDVDQEITFLITRHGDQAYQAALAAAAKPNLRTRRRKVLQAAARELNPSPRLFGIFKIPRPRPGRPTAPKGPARSVLS